MSYFEEFQRRIEREDYAGFLQIWEEYYASDEVDGKELVKILDLIGHSRFAGRFGEHAETALPLWEKVADEHLSLDALRWILDLQTTNSPELAELAYAALEQLYSQQESFAAKIRLVGLRSRQQFTGAIRNYELLTHLDKGRFVYHTGGWGAGEVIDVSLVREELVLEFEGLSGRKSLSFDNAFGTLVALEDGHFLARRFGDPDALEEEARANPVSVVRMLLQDLGPKTAADIKDELCELVIPDEDWTKWWQSARGRIKRDTMIETPATIRDPFRLRDTEVSHAARLKTLLQQQESPSAILTLIYNFLRDFPDVQKSEESKAFIREQLEALLQQDRLALPHQLETYALLEELFGDQAGVSLKEAVKELTNIVWVVEAIEIGAFKKRILVVVREQRADWGEVFLDALFALPQSSLRDYLFRELNTEGMRDSLRLRLEELVDSPTLHPHLFVWFFSKAVSDGESLPFATESGRCLLLEGLLSLLYQLEQMPEHRELVKKIYGIITGKRFLVVRDILKGSTREFAGEFLLLTSKCQTFNDHEIKIMQSLAEVVHPSLAVGSRRGAADDEKEVLWTTQAGYDKIKDRISHIGTVEIVEVAKEIEKAREHGDLRENAEYKIAQERRSRLQSEMRQLSDQLHQARILTVQDVSTDRVGVGNIVELTDSGGKIHRYTLLGPWDADPDQHILSFRSRLAQTMSGLKAGDTFEYQDAQYTVTSIANWFDEAAV